MAYFQLFEQFIFESELEDNKKELEKTDADIKSSQEAVDKAQAAVDKEKAEFDKWNEGYEKRKEGYKGNYYLDTKDEYNKANAKLDDLETTLFSEEEKLKRLKNDRDYVLKQIEKKDKKSAAKGSSKQDAVLSKLKEVEDDIESSVDYDFDAYPSSQIKKVMAGGDEAKEIIKKYNQKINDIKSEISDISDAMMDAKDEGDKEQLIELKLELELRKAEAELFAAIIKGEPEGLAMPLKKIKKINQKMDQTGSDD